MKALCPTCHGKGRITDPQCIGRVLAYCGPNGERAPTVTCESCAGSGWVVRDDGVRPAYPLIPQDLTAPAGREGT